MEYCLPVIQTEATGAWHNISKSQTVRISDKNQTQKDEHYMITSVWLLEKTNLEIQKPDE